LHRRDAGKGLVALANGGTRGVQEAGGLMRLWTRGEHGGVAAAPVVPWLARLSIPRLSPKALRYRDFRLILIGQTISITGNWAQVVAQGLLLLDLTNNSAAMLGLLGFTYLAPGIPLSLLGGVLTDRIDRKRLLVSAFMVEAGTAFALWAFVALGNAEVWHLFVTVLILGSCSALRQPPLQSLVPDLVPGDTVLNANTLRYAALYLGRAIGPLVGGLMIATIGFSGAFFVNALSFVAPLIAVWVARIPAKPAGSGKTLLAQLAEGSRYVLRERVILGLLALVLIPSLLALPFLYILPVYGREAFDLGSAATGLLMGAFGAGALVGLVFMLAKGDIERRGRWLIATAFAQVAGLSLVAFAPHVSVAIVITGVLGAIGIVYQNILTTLFLVLPPAELRGRTLGFMNFAGNFQPFGNLAIGVLAAAIGVRLSIEVFAVLLLATFLLTIINVKAIRDV
jgi:MFS family permease